MIFVVVIGGVLFVGGKFLFSGVFVGVLFIVMFDKIVLYFGVLLLVILVFKVIVIVVLCLL